MKIVIFGGAGFIGTNTCLEALERGHEVIAFDNLMRSGVDENLPHLEKHKNFTFIKGDITKKKHFELLPKRVDALINFAANPAIPLSIQRPLWDFEINVMGHINILEYARHHGQIPVILASSNKVYTDKINTYELVEEETRYRFKDKKLAQGFDEFTDTDGNEGYTNSPYGSAKVAAEKYSREYWKHYGVPVTINRMSCIYGQYQKGVEDQGWLDWFLRAKRLGLPINIFGDGKQVRDVLFGRDVAELYIDQVEDIAPYNGKSFNIGGGGKKGYHVSLLETIAMIDELFPGKKLKYSFGPWRKSDQRVYISDISRITSVCKWKPTTDITNGLKNMWKAHEREYAKA